MEIEYSPIIERCKMLSAFDARQAHTTTGESLYEEVRITDSDQIYVKEHIKQAAQFIESQLSNLLSTEGEYDDTKVTWTFNDGALNRQTETSNAFLMTIQEAMANYALYRWLESKLPEKAKGYSENSVTLMSAAMKIIKTKAKPTMPE